MASLRIVLGLVAGAVVHGVVVHESQFVAREQLSAIAVESCQVELAVPETALQHASGVVERLTGVDGLGIAERERAEAAVAHAVHRGHLLVVIEHQLAVLVV